MEVGRPTRRALLLEAPDGDGVAQEERTLRERDWEVVKGGWDAAVAGRITLAQSFALILLSPPPGPGSGRGTGGIRPFLRELEEAGQVEAGTMVGVLVGGRSAPSLGAAEAEEAGVLRIARTGKGGWRLSTLLELLEHCVLGMQTRLRASEALFAALDHCPVPVEITDAQNHVQYVNAAFESLTGCLRSDVLGSESSDLRRKSLPPTDEPGSADDIPWTCLPVSAKAHAKGESARHYVYIRAKPGPSDVSGGRRSATSARTPLANPPPFPTPLESSGRRHTMDPRRLNGPSPLPPTVKAPLSEILCLLKSVQEQHSDDPALVEPITQVMKILSTNELYTPLKTRLKSEDKVSIDLFDGLVRNGPVKGPKNRKMSLSDAIRHSQRPSLGQHSVEEESSSHSGAGPTGRQSRSLSPAEEDSSLSEAPDSLEEWTFDVLNLERLGEHRPLHVVGVPLLEKWRVGEFLSCPKARLSSWLIAMGSGYHSGNPYHNASHAADVLHATAYWLAQHPVAAALEHEDAVALLLGAVIHDIDHPGRGSAFLINTRHPLAVLYNDISVLESHHASFAFQLTLGDARINIMAGLGRAEFVALRRTMVELVLATDMTKHFELTAKFQQVILDPPAEEVSVSARDVVHSQRRLTISRILIKCADISNPLRPWDTCREWAFRILEEYFRQTAEEQAKGLPLTMAVFDRTSCNIPQTQCSFIDMFARDMFRDWTKFAGTVSLLEQLEKNYCQWSRAAAAWPDSRTDLGCPASLAAHTPTNAVTPRRPSASPLLEEVDSIPLIS